VVPKKEPNEAIADTGGTREFLFFPKGDKKFLPDFY